MSINYQINNLFHILQFYNNHKLNINYIKTNSLYDLFINGLENYIFIDNNVISQKNISYGLTFINNIMIVANNIQMIQNMYSNKIIFIHDDLVNSLKKEDFFILFNSVKDYSIYSFVPNVVSDSMKYMQYGFQNNVTKSSKDRTIDILLLYQQQNKKQTETLFQSLKRTANKNVELVCIDHITSREMAISLLNNTKVCVDTNSYYNLLLASSCGCKCIGFNNYHDPEIVRSETNLENVVKASTIELSAYNDQYIDFAQKFIDVKYNYKNYIDNMESIINNHLSSEVLL